MTLWQHLLLAMAAGVLLNLTPCVLPALPIKLRSIGRVVGDKPLQRLLAGLALLAGTLTFFGGLGLTTAWLNWTWGTLFQAPWFRLSLAMLLAALGTWSLAGRGLAPPQWAYRIQGFGYAEPYFCGLLAAVLSAPCTGPFLGGVMAFALTQSPTAIVSLFLAVGLGLALPYLVLLARPGWLARLPRGGAWLTRIHQALGLLLLAGAAFFAGTVLPPGADALLWALWLFVFAFWLLRAAWIGPGAGARLVPAVAVTLVVLTAWAVSPAQDSGAERGLEWQPLTSEALTAARSQGRPVLIEFTADWCINCKVLEKTVYNDAGVVAMVEKNDMHVLRADLTRPDPDLQAYLRRFGGAGLPFAVVLDRDGEITARLPDLFTAGTLTTAITMSMK